MIQKYHLINKKSILNNIYELNIFYILFTLL